MRGSRLPRRTRAHRASRAASNTARYYSCYARIVRVTSKGQVTIPQKIRELLGITPGSEVDFQVEGPGARLVRVSSGDGKAVAGRMRGRATTAMSTEEIMALTRADE